VEAVPRREHSGGAQVIYFNLCCTGIMLTLMKHHLYVLKQLRGTSAKLQYMILVIGDGSWDKNNVYVQFRMDQGEPRQNVCIWGGIKSGIP
jgi:hypothetical protein